MLRSWDFDPAVLGPVAAAGALYAWGLVRVRRVRGPRAFPPRRAAFFWAGLAVVLLAVEGPMHHYAHLLLSVHMAQHLALTMVAAPLLVLGTPGVLALQASSREVRRSVVVPALHSRLARTVASPVACWVLFATVLWGTHYSALYDAAVRSSALHAVEHGALLAAAVLFWFPVVGLDPGPRRLSHPGRLLYLFLSMPVTAVLGLSIYSADRVLYPSYAGSTRSLGLSPLSDQHLAGAMMWESGMVVVVVALGAVLFDWLNREERAGEREDARRDRAAARAASSG